MPERYNDSLRRFRPYPAHKDSGVEWLGEVPERWQTKRLKYLAAFFGGGTPSKNNPEYWSGEIPWVSPKDMVSSQVVETQDHISEEALRESATRMVQPGSVLIVVRSGILRHTIPVAINTCPVALNQDMKAVVPNTMLLAGYLAHLIRGCQDSLLIEWRKSGATVESIEADLLTNTLFPLPPVGEQIVITAFLDRETARIDELVGKKERLIDLLQEKRAALITHAVTKGLDPNVPMKDSGVEWLDEIPAHWDGAKMWRISNAVSGGTPAKDERSYWDGDIPWVSPKDMKRRLIDSSEDTITERAIAETGIKLVTPPVVLIVVRGMILAHSFPVAITAVPVTINQDMKALRFRHDVDPVFMAWLFEGAGKAFLGAAVEEAAHGTRAIRMDQWRLVVAPVPPTSEQRAIAAFLNRETARIGALIAKVKEAIERLKEYRTALITAAVTGKIDVREEVSH